MTSLIISVDGSVAYTFQRETTQPIRHRGYTRETTQSREIAFCWQEMPIIFFKYFILIIIVESKYLKDYFVLFVCSRAEHRLTVVITVRNDLLQNVSPILPRNIGQTGQFEQYLSFSFYQGTR